MRIDPTSLWTMPVAIGMAAASSGWAVEYLSVAEAQKALFPTATAFAAHPLELSDEERDRIKELSGSRQRKSSQQVWQARAGDARLGWFIVDEVVGKHEFITYACGIGNDGIVRGLEILVYREAHGGQVREATWRAHFTGKTLADRFELDVDVPNISGATLSSRNVMKGVQRLLALHRLLLAEVP